MLGIALTASVASWQQRRTVAEEEMRRQNIFGAGFSALRERLRSCALMVRSIQGLYIASNTVTPDEFLHAYENLRAHEIFSSLQAISFARYQQRADGDHYVVELVAPYAGNEGLLNVDISTQAGNLDAARRALEADMPMLSAPFLLAQLVGTAQTDHRGVTIRVPVYKAGPLPGSDSERKARMVGSLAAAFRIRPLVETALPPEIRDLMHIEVDDITGPRSSRIYDSHPWRTPDDEQDVRMSEVLEFGGRRWQLTMYPRHPIERLGWRQSVWPPGLLASLLLASLVWSMTSTRRRAIELGSRMSQRFRESEERFRSLNELLPALVVLARASDRGIDYVNQAARERLGPVDEAGVALESLFITPSEREGLAAIDDEAQWRNVEVMMRALSGELFWASVSITSMQMDGEDKLLMVAKDITEQRELIEQISYQSSHDPLTDLYSRREFERRLEAALRGLDDRGRPFALLYIDLDQFKVINDLSGHAAGDLLLRQLALLMAEQMRAEDVLARLGGDEFGVIAFDLTREAAEALAERLCKCIRSHQYAWDQRSYTINASIGVVLVDQPHKDLREVLSQVDSACYMAKDGGRNRTHVYSEQDDDTILRRKEIEWVARLRRAIEEERLLLYYQEMKPLQQEPGPGADIELLLRLRDEEGGIVLPGAFMGAAERYGVIGELDRWVVGQAIRNFGALHPEGMQVRCSINLSARSIEDGIVIDEILAMLAEYQVPSSAICFEVTETAAIRNFDRAIHFITRLRDAGCKVSLDDFGAGMASFAYLKNLPVDFIKIDGSFIRDLETDPVSRAIVEAIVQIGHQRDADVVAEWVETPALLEVLRELGVDYAQGFLVHRPEPVLFQRH